jgi:tRNA A-37 threonylcarbamoyl transferase component Bud32
MKYSENDMAIFYYDPGRAVHSCVTEFCSLAAKHPLLLEPFKGNDEKLSSALASRFSADDADAMNNALPFSCDRKPIAYINGYYLLPTVPKTTLLYHGESDCFLKVIHSLTLKSKIVSFFTDRARRVFELTGHLRAMGFQVPVVHAYGMFRKSRSVFYIMERVKGNSLYDILVKKKEALPGKMYEKVIDALADLHNSGYWFGDLRIAHIFVQDSNISGFVDIDSIKRNSPFRMKNIAKDLAGLNQPELPLSEEEKKRLLQYYMSKSNRDGKAHLPDLIKRYSVRRWGA